MRHSLKKIIHDTRIFLDLNHDAPPLVETAHCGNLAIDDIIRSKVEEMVSTYHPEGEHPKEIKGETYEKLLKTIRV